MAKALSVLSLADLIDSTLKNVDFLTEIYAIEENYGGNYADLSSNDELQFLEAFRQRPWREVVYEKFAGNSPWLYQIIVDNGRALFLDLLELPQGGTYLDVGSGWGQVSIPLSRKGQVVALDLTANRLRILQTIAKQEEANLYFAQGNFLTFPFKQNVFDLIVFNGSLEWISLDREEDKKIWDVQVEALSRACDILKPEGQIYVGIENSLGLKYLLGCADDHTGFSLFTFLPEMIAEKIYNSQKSFQKLPVKTWSLIEYRQMVAKAGLEEMRIYCCFPDYKLIRRVVDIRDVNKYLILHGLPVHEHNGTDGNPFGHEKELDAIYRLLARNEIAQYFCPSYGLILSKRR